MVDLDLSRFWNLFKIIIDIFEISSRSVSPTMLTSELSTENENEVLDRKKKREIQLLSIRFKAVSVIVKKKVWNIFQWLYITLRLFWEYKYILFLFFSYIYYHFIIFMYKSHNSLFISVVWSIVLDLDLNWNYKRKFVMCQIHITELNSVSVLNSWIISFYIN